jgi:hypothetical protein
MASAWQRTLAALIGAVLLMGAQNPPADTDNGQGFDGDDAEMAEPGPAAPTRILSQPDAKRLRRLTGITLQWIGWDKDRGGAITMVSPDGVWRIYGEQRGDKDQAVLVDGIITEIGPNYFIMEGAVTIANSPDQGRICEGYGKWRFAITQNRKYYRLREFEWCDYLTDYIDLYF